MTGSPLDTTMLCCSVRGLIFFSILEGDYCAVMAIRSLAASNISGMEGECSSPSWLSLSGEFISTRLSGTPCGAGVDGVSPREQGAECPVTGRTRLSPFPTAFTVGKHPLYVFFCLLCGTREWERCWVFGARGPSVPDPPPVP